MGFNRESFDKRLLHTFRRHEVAEGKTTVRSVAGGVQEASSHDCT